MALKRTEKTQKTIGDYDFYINKFGAFKSANLSGELVSLFAPIIASIVPVVSNIIKDSSDTNNESDSILDKDIDKVLDSMAPALSGAFSNLSGKQLESLMFKLLIEEKNISFAPKGSMNANECETLTWDDADEIFCGDLQDMYQLAITVIQINYKGFFSKLAAQYGLDMEKVGAAMMKSPNMASLMSASSAN